MCCVLVRFQELCNVFLILCSLELLKLKSRTEIHERVRNGEKKKEEEEKNVLTCFAEVNV